MIGSKSLASQLWDESGMPFVAFYVRRDWPLVNLVK
jgi:hypothetical protein